MDDPKIAVIVQKLRIRERRYEAMKKDRHVSFADLPNGKDDKSEDLCIFRAARIRERLEEWPMEQKPKPDIYKTVVECIKTHAINDVAVSFKNIHFKCPLILLNCFSQFFKNSDEGTRIDLTIYNIRPKCFSKIFSWMLTEAIHGKPGICEINHDCVLELLNASKQLKMKHLEDQCWYFLKKTAQCDENIAFDLYKASDYNLKEVQQLMLSRICKYFLTLVSSEDYLNLNIDEICILLSLNSLGVNSEIETFYAAVLWLNYMWSARNEDNLVKRVIDCVRFDLMPPWFLISLNERTGVEEIDKITDIQYVANIITDAIIFTATQLSWLTGAYKASDNKLEQFNQSIPSQRRWIYDKSCSYHFHRDDNYMEYVTLEMFTNYLKCLQTFGKDYWRTLDYATADHCIRVWKSRPKVTFI